MTGARALFSRPVAPDDFPRLLALAGACAAWGSPHMYAHPGDVVWREYGPAPAPRPPEDATLWSDVGGTPAHAWFEPPAHVEFQIDPGTDLDPFVPAILDWAEQRRRAYGADSDQPLSTPVLASDHKRAVVLGRLGFEPMRPSGTRFAYRLDRALPASLLPARARLRHATDADIETRTALHRAAWSVWGPSSATAENYRQMRSAPLYDETLDVVVEWQGRLISYCVCWADPASGTGLFEPVGTHRDYTGEGYARAVIAEALLRMRARGLHTAYVSTAAVNARALALYSGLGFEEVDTLTLWERRAP